MLACARIGAVHSVVFGGFSSESLADRWGHPLAIGMYGKMKNHDEINL